MRSCTHTLFALSSTLSLVLLLGVLSPAAFANSPYIKDVCASGCTYSNVQDAIDSISDSDSNNVYTIFVGAGVLDSDTSITTAGKSYINFTGLGMGVSVLRASQTWFENVGASNMDFLDLRGSSHITIRGLTIDARTQDPGNLTFSSAPNCIAVEGDRILIDSAEILGTAYGIWESSGSSSRLIEMFNSKVRAVDYAVLIRQSVWHIFSSDIRAIDDGTSSLVPEAVVGLVAGSGGSVNTTIWGSHIHAESSVAGKTYEVEAAYDSMASGSSLTFVGTTLHVKMKTSDIGSPGRQMHSYFMKGLQGTVHLIDCQLLYENSGTLSQGTIGGIGFGINFSTHVLDLVGVDVIDGGGSGGTYRADITGFGSTTNQPTVRTTGSKIRSILSTTGVPLTGVSVLESTVNTQRGQIQFGGTSSITVAFSRVMPDVQYRVSLSADRNETVWVSNKTINGFTVNSSNPNSAASVDWAVSR